MQRVRVDPRRREAAARLAARVGESPTFLPALVCVGVLVWFAGDEGGFHDTTFLPATLLVLALLVVCLAVLPRPRPSRTVLVAVGAFSAYALWSYLSLLWADDQAIAWDGANRTVLYAALLALMALWPMRGWAAATLLGAYGIGVTVVGVVELLKVGSASQAIQYFHEGRLSEPAGYANANVALWFTAFWPCLVLAGRREVPAALRGLLLSCSTVLAGLAILGESRGWLFALPLVLVLALVLVPGRGRTIVALAAVGGAIAMVLGPLIDVYDAFKPFKPPGATYNEAVRLLLAASAGIGLLWAGAAQYERTVHLSAARARRISGALLAVVVGAVVLGGAGYAVAERSPFSVVADRWAEFKKGGTEPSFGTSRFTTNASSYRYDYLRVAWKEFERHPLAGVGVDNFQLDYLAQGRTHQTPAYPHSTPLRALSETGLVGAFLFFGALIAALLAARPALRGPPLASGAAGAGLLMFGYWLVHGSIDWLWEFPGLSGPALMGLGLAMATAAGLRQMAHPGDPLLKGRAAVAVTAVLALALGAGLVMPWLAARDLSAARNQAGSDPAGALAHLRQAASLNPLSPLPARTAGLIRVRQGDFARATQEFRKALDRVHRDAFSTLMLAEIASKQGQRPVAERLMRRVRQLAPRWPVLLDQERLLRSGRRLDPQRLESAFRADIRARIGAN
jgi:tetratricopeptide (TPR) repeat protein